MEWVPPLALALATARAKINLIGRRQNALESVAAKARSMGAEARCYSADLTSSVGQFELVQRLKRDLRHVDILIQSAGVHFTDLIEHASVEDFDIQYQTNMRAPYVLTQGLLPMLKERRGQVVFINSSSGIAAKPMTAQYDLTKHALRAIADSLRGEINVHGVRVLSVYLGRTATDMQKKIFQTEKRPYRPELLLQPEDVASVILNALSLPRTTEVTDIHIRPMIKSNRSDLWRFGSYEIFPTELHDAWLIKLEPTCDNRGFFVRTFCVDEFAAHGLETSYVQHSTSFSARKGTLRGMHCQREPHSEVKVVRCVKGTIWDVIIDIQTQFSYLSPLAEF